MVLNNVFGFGGRKEQDAVLCMLHDLYSSANTVRVKKSRNLAGHVSCKGEKRKA